VAIDVLFLHYCAFAMCFALVACGIITMGCFDLHMFTFATYLGWLTQFW
jgi:hypothetical protein